jgi:hypothetical protein
LAYVADCGCITGQIQSILARYLELRRALDGADAGHSANAEDHAVQVVQVFGFYYEGYGGFAVVVAADIYGADVGVVVGDYSG